jgi:hypothetical protein
LFILLACNLFLYLPFSAKNLFSVLDLFNEREGSAYLSKETQAEMLAFLNSYFNSLKALSKQTWEDLVVNGWCHACRLLFLNISLHPKWWKSNNHTWCVVTSLVSPEQWAQYISGPRTLVIRPKRKLKRRWRNWRSVAMKFVNSFYHFLQLILNTYIPYTEVGL